MTDYEIFCDFYRCSIEETDRTAFYKPVSCITTNIQPNLVTNPTVIGSSGSEKTNLTKVVAIYLPEDMAHDLITRTVELIKEAELRSTDLRLLKMYSQYKTMASLLK